MNENGLIELAKQYASLTGLSVSTVSTYATGDGATFNRLATNKTITVRRSLLITKWFAANWPRGEAWPRGINRPLLSAAEAEKLLRIGKRELARRRKAEARS